MKTFQINAFEIYDTDGYTHTHRCYVSSESLAKEIAGTGGYVGFNPVEKTITIFDTKEEYENDQRQKKLEKIKSKLTPDELKFLGL